MESGDRTILDRPGASTSASSAIDPGSSAGACRSVPARRSYRAWGWAAIALIIASAIATAWYASRRPTDPDRLWAEAERAFLAGRWDRARDMLKSLARVRPRVPLDWLLEGQLATAEGRLDEALAALGRIPDDHAMAAQAHLLVGRIERQRLRVRHAEAAYRRALSLKPGLVDAHKELIYVLGIQSRRREVDAEFHELARRAPLTHHDLFTWALTHFTAWGPDIAGDLESFIRADPDDRFSRLALANLLIDHPGEEARVERVLQPLPEDDAEAQALRIELKLNHGQVDEALAMLARATARHPHLARLRGRVALRRGDASGAIRHFQDALSDEPYDRVSNAELGKALVLQGDRSAAERYLTRARQLDEVYNLINRIKRPGSENQPPDLTRLGRACEAAGLLDEARGWYMLAIGRDPLDTEAQQAVHRIRASLP
jgi:tetratricopeptide (TPR) repeat protein